MIINNNLVMLINAKDIEEARINFLKESKYSLKDIEIKEYERFDGCYICVGKLNG